MLKPGQVVDRYELVCPLASGGMAQVWAARQRGLHGFEKLFAFKVIHAQYAQDAAFRAMFFDEAKLVASISHANVAQVFDLGERDGLLYMVMEYVDGESLFELTAPDKSVPLDVALRIAADACAGLEAVHGLVDARGQSRNVVHRDVSPQNILVGARGEVKVIDFGIAHARDRAASRTEVGTIKGTIRYMAPEQARNEPLGPHTDVFGIGATLFRMLAGRAPYASQNDLATMQALLAGAPPLSPLPPNLPQPIRSMVLRAIAANIAHRCHTARDLRAALEQALAGMQPNVAAWAQANGGDAGRERRARVANALSNLANGPVVPDLAPPPKAPGMMDVHALMEQAKSGPPPNTAPPPPGSPPQARGVQRPTPKAPPPAEKFKGPLKAAIGAIAIVVLVAAALLVSPMIAREQAISAAKEAGFTMTVGRAGVQPSGITLRDVTLTVARSPTITAKVPELEVLGFLRRDVRLTKPEIHIDGDRKILAVDIATLISDLRAKEAGKPDAPRKLSINDASIEWKNLSGPSSVFTASKINCELESRSPANEDWKTTIGTFTYDTPSAKVGPWGLTIEASPDTGRTRLAFDPAVPDGASALVVSGRNLPPELTLKIPRSSFAHLGIRPEDIGIPADPNTEIEIETTGKILLGGHSELKVGLGLWQLHPQNTAPVDLRVDGTLLHDPDKPWTLDKTTATVGPFNAALSGTITPTDAGIRMDLLFKAVPIECSRLAKLVAAQQGGAAAAIQALGSAMNIVRLTGTVNASGVVKYDTSSPDETSITWVAHETCGVSIFGM